MSRPTGERRRPKSTFLPLSRNTTTATLGGGLDASPLFSISDCADIFLDRRFINYKIFFMKMMLLPPKSGSFSRCRLWNGLILIWSKSRWLLGLKQVIVTEKDNINIYYDVVDHQLMGL